MTEPRVLSKDELWDVMVKYSGHPDVLNLIATLNAEKAQPRHGCLGCPMVAGKCPHCGNEEMPSLRERGDAMSLSERGKKTFRVLVRRELVYELEVEAESPSEAAMAAKEVPVPEHLKGSIDSLPVTNASTRCQMEGPWVYGATGDDPDNAYYGRPDGYMETSDLLVFYSPYGCYFSEADVELLRSRVEKTVGPVGRLWNGVRCNSLSIQMASRFDKLTDEQVAAIMAPKIETEGGKK